MPHTLYRTTLIPILFHWAVSLHEPLLCGTNSYNLSLFKSSYSLFSLHTYINCASYSVTLYYEGLFGFGKGENYCKRKKAFSLSCIIQHSVFAKKRIRNLFFQNQSDKNKSKTNFFFFYQEKESKKKKNLDQ